MISKKKKTVLIGFGSVAAGIAKDKKMAHYIKYQTHAQVLKDHPDFDWLGVVDPNSEARKEAREVWGVPHAVASADELQGLFEPEVAVISTRPDVRLKIIKQLPSVKAVIVEKPLGYNLKEAKCFVDVCRQRKIKTQVNLFRRSEETYKLLDFEKLVGKPQAIFVVYGNGIRNNAVHIIDVIQMLFGEIKSAQALGPSIPLKAPVVHGDINIPFSVRLPNNATATFLPVDFSHYRDVVLDIWGENGRLEIFQEGLFVRHSPIREHRALEGHNEIAMDEPVNLPSQCGTAYYALYDNLIKHLNGEEKLDSPAENALTSELIPEAVVISEKNGGKPVDIDEMMTQLFD